MALTNALSAIALVGSIVILGQGETTYAKILGFIAVVCSSINVVGGFIITDRMLKMFKPREQAEARRDRGRGALMSRMDWINLAYLFGGARLRPLAEVDVGRPPPPAAACWPARSASASRSSRRCFWPGITTQGYILIAVAALIGSAIGVPLGLLVPMTAMPQRIALSHAFGGLAAALVGCAHYYLDLRPPLEVRHLRARHRDRPRVPGLHRQS